MLTTKAPVAVGEVDEPFDLAAFVERLKPAWMAKAACRGLGNLFFQSDPVGHDSSWQRRAKAICAECPVRYQCLDHAIAHGPVYGVWGGTSERARQQMKHG
jgi:WhiB family redox-sensing transcriptional regulator